MCVQVIGQAGAGASAEVVSDVETLRIERRFEQVDAVANGEGQFVQLVVGEVAEVALVLGERDEEVAVGVGEAVHDGEGGLGSPDDVVFAVELWLLPVAAEKAAVVLGLVFQRADEVHSPGSPQILIELGHRGRFSQGFAEFIRLREGGQAGRFARVASGGRLSRVMKHSKQLVFVSLIGAMAFGGGCSETANINHREIKAVTVRATSQYGINLDKDATPLQVAYVLLRAIHEDFVATKAQERNAALDVQFDIAAANVIQKGNRTGLAREKYVHNVVTHWTPTVAHYVKNFQTDWDRARSRFRQTQPKAISTGDASAMACEVLMELDDPSGDPNAKVVMVIWMAQDKGFWRVVHLGFETGARSLAGLAALGAAARPKPPNVGG